MAKKSMINRELKRIKLVERMGEKRKELKRKMLDPNLSEEERAAAAKQFHRMPRDSSPTRIRNRCRVTGRPHGFYRNFGLGRNKLREYAMRGDIPGLVKSSW